MTIRIEHLTIERDDHAWLNAEVDGGIDLIDDETFRFDLLSVVRHILRERSDSNMIPVVKAAVLHPTNQFGHNLQVEVQYHTRGYRSIYGAHVGSHVNNVQCYMD